MKKAAILLIGIFLSLFIIGCSAQEAIHTTTDDEVIIRGRTGDSTYQVPRVDSATHTIITIDYAHHEIHDGNAYTIVNVDEDLDIGETFDLTLITPDTTKWFHSLWSAEGTLAIHIYIYEGATTNVTGANLTSVNRDRNSINTSDAITRDGDTFTDTGTLIWQWHSGERKVSGSGEELEEFILRQNTQYLFRVESEADNNKVSGQISWYEHTNRSP